MAITPNFNTLVFIGKFNNYFNRKVIGSPYFVGYLGDHQEYDGQEHTNYKLLSLPAEDFRHIGSDWVSETNMGGIIPINVIPQVIIDGGSEFSYQYDEKTQILKIYCTNYPQEEVVDVELTYKLYGMQTFNQINFNPNDSIMTEIVINDLSFDPDYLLVLDKSVNESPNIVSRWFVMKANRTRSGQVQISLKRDVIYDHLNDILEAPIYVHKGMLDDDDAFAVNTEGMMVNQIKKKEISLWDKTLKMSYAILYIAKNTPQTKTTGTNIEILISDESTRLHTQDQNFDIVCIPFNPSKNDYKRGYYFVNGPTQSRNIESILIEPALFELIENLGDYLYDVQLLPYCPLPKAVISSTYYAPGNPFIAGIDTWLLNPYGTTTRTAPTEHHHFDYIIDHGDSDLAKGIVFYVPFADFETDLCTEDSDTSYKTTITTDLTKKEASNLQLFRFVSPNYQGTFDLNIAKNDNKIDNIKAYCTYKPYVPFIKVAPKFYNFYGEEYIDNRGLICGGDFSMGKISDAWIQFQLQNKNYQNIFNREIQNLDFNYSIEQRNQIVSGAVGIFSSGLTGAGAGAVAGSVAGPYGMIAGAAIGGIIGTVSSATGAVIDTLTLAAQHRERKSLAIDKFNYQLGNIQALPYTLTKVSVLDYASKIFPFVEEYDCTNEELLAFRNKIKYESMTVMRIDKMSNYYHKFKDLCYFKGELIRNDNIAVDHYILLAIYDELMKGVYI